ncbi:MAG: hypothetical protein AAF489_15490 [Bacteroidota bacterium]
MKLLTTISCVLFIGCLSLVAQVPVPQSTSSNTISGANWSKTNSVDFVLRDANGKVLSNVKDLLYLGTETLAVLDRTNRDIYLLKDFKNASTGAKGSARILASNIGKDFFITHPNSFANYVNEKSASGPFTNINGSYIYYIEDSKQTYLLKDIRKFSDWGAASSVKLDYSSNQTYWYRDAEKTEYGIIAKGKTIDYDKVTSQKDGNNLIIKIDGVKTYILKGYYTKASFVYSPVALYSSSAPTTNTAGGCVRGNCQDGWGKYEYDGGHYDGFWTNGLKHGYGLYKWEDSGKYIGNWENDKMKGYGVYIAANEDNIIGQYSEGQLNGLGITVTGDTWKQGIFSNGSIVTNYDFYANEAKTGCVSGNCQDKYGRFKWDNGDQYTGFFKNGRLHMGTYTFANGSKYSGMFNSDNQFHGMGRFFFEDNAYYGGQWRNGKYNGRGYYHNKDLEQQIGEWSNGKLVKSLK